jgi:hypothetical protein
MSHPEEAVVELKKGEYVKKIVLLSVVALMLAYTVFAPVAQAQELGEINIQSVTLDPLGNVDIVGTIQCKEGYSYAIGVGVVQGEKTPKHFLIEFVKTKKFHQRVSTVFFGDCETTGAQSFAFKLGFLPWEEGKVWVGTQSQVCGGSPVTCQLSEPIWERYKIG